MARTLRVLFRRDPSRDREDNHIHFEGYEVLWPDGRSISLGFDAFCKHGQRLLGLGRHLAGCRERLVDMLCFPRRGEDEMTRLPGHRVRRFFLERQGRRGRVHFLNGTPTAIVFDLDHDEAPVLHWIGLPALAEGARQWFDVAASTVEPAARFPAFSGAAYPAPVA